MDLSAAWDGIGRDLSELAHGGAIGWLVLVGLVALPVVALLAVRTTRLAWLALALWFVTPAVWVAYYATDLWGDPGLAGFYALMAPAAAAWLVLAVGVLRDRARRP